LELIVLRKFNQRQSFDDISFFDMFSDDPGGGAFGEGIA